MSRQSALLSEQFSPSERRLARFRDFLPKNFESTGSNNNSGISNVPSKRMITDVTNNMFQLQHSPPLQNATHEHRIVLSPDGNHHPHATGNDIFGSTGNIERNITPVITTTATAAAVAAATSSTTGTTVHCRNDNKENQPRPMYPLQLESTVSSFRASGRTNQTQNQNQNRRSITHNNGNDHHHNHSHHHHHHNMKVDGDGDTVSQQPIKQIEFVVKNPRTPLHDFHHSDKYAYNNSDGDKDEDEDDDTGSHCNTLFFSPMSTNTNEDTSQRCTTVIDTKEIPRSTILQTQHHRTNEKHAIVSGNKSANKPQSNMKKAAAVSVSPKTILFVSQQNNNNNNDDQQILFTYENIQSCTTVSQLIRLRTRLLLLVDDNTQLPVVNKSSSKSNSVKKGQPSTTPKFDNYYPSLLRTIQERMDHLRSSSDTILSPPPTPMTFTNNNTNHIVSEVAAETCTGTTMIPTTPTTAYISTTSSEVAVMDHNKINPKYNKDNKISNTTGINVTTTVNQSNNEQKSSSVVLSSSSSSSSLVMSLSTNDIGMNDVIFNNDNKNMKDMSSSSSTITATRTYVGVTQQQQIHPGIQQLLRSVHYEREENNRMQQQLRKEIMTRQEAMEYTSQILQHQYEKQFELQCQTHETRMELVRVQTDRMILMEALQWALRDSNTNMNRLLLPSGEIDLHQLVSDFKNHVVSQQFMIHTMMKAQDKPDRMISNGIATGRNVAPPQQEQHQLIKKEKQQQKYLPNNHHSDANIIATTPKNHTGSVHWAAETRNTAGSGSTGRSQLRISAVRANGGRFGLQEKLRQVRRRHVDNQSSMLQPVEDATTISRNDIERHRKLAATKPEWGGTTNNDTSTNLKGRSKTVPTKAMLESAAAAAIVRKSTTVESYRKQLEQVGIRPREARD